MEIYRQIKNLYGKRSRYVHGGETVIRYADLIELREIVRASLTYALRWLAAELGGRMAHEECDTSNLRDLFEGTVLPLIRKSDFGNFPKHCDVVRFGGPRFSLQPATGDATDDDEGENGGTNGDSQPW